MEVMVLQNDIRWLDVDANLAGYGDILEDACKAGGNWPDVVVLPEMFATGFCMEPEKCAPSAGAVVEWMKEAASKYDTAIAGTMAVETPDGYRNRFCFVRPDGIVTHYDKRHLFTFAGEDRSYVCGNRRVIVRWRGFDVLLQTCYDLRFPVFSRSRGDYHLALYCASWPVPRIAVWDTLLRARAIENVSYVVGANRVGEDPAGTYPGHSVVVGFRGDVLAQTSEGRTGYVTYSLSLEELLSFREKFPVLEDGDEFVLA